MVSAKDHIPVIPAAHTKDKCEIFCFSKDKYILKKEENNWLGTGEKKKKGCKASVVDTLNKSMWHPWEIKKKKETRDLLQTT